MIGAEDLNESVRFRARETDFGGGYGLWNWNKELLALMSWVSAFKLSRTSHATTLPSAGDTLVASKQKVLETVTFVISRLQFFFIIRTTRFCTLH